MSEKNICPDVCEKPELHITGEVFIENGVTLMKKYGFAGLTLGRIIRTAKKSKASFYWHFGSKEIFVTEVVRRYFRPATDMLISLAVKDNVAGGEKIREWARFNENALNEAVSQKEHMINLTTMSVLFPDSAGLRSVCESIFRKREFAVEQILISSGYSSLQIGERSACLILAMLDGVMAEALRCREPERIRDFFAFLFPCKC